MDGAIPDMVAVGLPHCVQAAVKATVHFFGRNNADIFGQVMIQLFQQFAAWHL